jgi:hypothetical protein
MGKLLLISIMIVAVAAPARAANDPNPVRGLKKLLVYVCLADTAYLFFVAFVYHRF